MKITKKEIFKTIMQNFGITTQIKETKKVIVSGKYKYYKDENIIIKEFQDVEYIGGKYEKVAKVVEFALEKTLGTIQLINKESKRVVMNFKHQTEPLVLI